ncbi:hypothetical protein N6G05_26470 [Cupriavidus gilardii]|uniref:hypothetical protein n=1 Tax=Cupriavidus gilardii TaxID=82541 RepID=UPI0021BEB330|nr:hypothetical protein [Cupriavidus gilardii]MCT9017099.1 hypothetical protein [Cupriavidus gilardii]MCT9056769.1 hypothetical protein [Cupriavidus gilardii]
MKWLPLLLAFTTGTAFAQSAYVMPPGSNQVGDTIKRSDFIYVLYSSKPCGLPIVNAKDMRRAEIFNSTEPDVGCWANTLSPTKGSILIVGPEGNTATGNLMGYAKTTINAAGDAVIAAPAFRRAQP